MKQLRQTTHFEHWFQRLRDTVSKGRILARLKMVANGHYGDCKPVGDGVIELRIFAGPGYRLYCSERENEVVLLLIGGDKSSQPRDIERAKQINREEP